MTAPEIPGTLNALARSIIAIADTADRVEDAYNAIFEDADIRLVAASAFGVATDDRFGELSETMQKVVIDHCAGCALDIAARIIIHYRQAQS